MGIIIKQRVDELGISKAEFARRINTTSQNIYGIFKRKSIDTNLLIKISQVLNHNFFQYFTSSVIKVKEEKEMLNSNISIVDLSDKISNIENKLQIAQKEISLKDKIILLLEEKIGKSK
ncbi:MAG: helix-turn-helix transcriptional regulator [Bacteroidales bacterium]|nr:helix-turn-helix transcriptional regulator [Bacteroidales bacterium]